MMTVLVAMAPLPLPESLTASQFLAMAEIPPELERFTALTNPNTLRAYRQDIRDFQAFADPHRPEQFRDEVCPVRRSVADLFRTDQPMERIAVMQELGIGCPPS